MLCSFRRTIVIVSFPLEPMTYLGADPRPFCSTMHGFQTMEWALNPTKTQGGNSHNIDVTVALVCIADGPWLQVTEFVLGELDYTFSLVVCRVLYSTVSASQ